MDVARPYTALGPSLDGAVLVVLAGTNHPLTGREIARLAGRKSHSGVLDALNRLGEQGLVDRAEAGRSALYTLNREHLAAPAVEALASMRTRLLERLRAAVGGWEIAPAHVSLFGSAARGDGDASSDIDLFVVRPRGVREEDPVWGTQRDALAVRVRRWTGNRAGLVEMGEQELRRLRKEPPPIVAELRRDAIVVHGLEISDVLGVT